MPAAAPDAPTTWACLDIGTNSVKLLVAQVDRSGTPHKLAHEVRITGMGQGLSTQGRLGEEGVQRTLDALHELLAAARSHAPQGVAALGMEAFRRAQNGLEVAERIRRTLGLSLTILTGEQEATLGREGVLRDLGPDPSGRATLVVDIGGGSTELSLSEPTWAASMPVGAVVVTEAFLQHDPPSPRELEAMHGSLRSTILATLQGAPAQARGARLVGVGGTATSLATMHLGLETYVSERVHRAQLSRTVTCALTERLTSQTLAERRAVVGLHPDRAPVIVAGAAILQAVLERVEADSLIISEANLLHAFAVRAALGLGLP